jgi:hypothetical protein
MTTKRGITKKGSRLCLTHLICKMALVVDFAIVQISPINMDSALKIFSVRIRSKLDDDGLKTRSFCIPIILSNVWLVLW